MQLVVAVSEGDWVTKETKRFRFHLIFCLTFSLAALRPLVASGSAQTSWPKAHGRQAHPGTGVTKH
jgi:hypothetical protein